jgi:hypothetical protein
MQIDRSNYEIWFLDWLDGNLDSLQAEQLKLFLDQNDDLREEFNDLTSVNLVSSGILFPYKEHLKRSPSDLSPSQFEYLCAACLENDLTNSQLAELKEIVYTYPDKKKTFDLIQKTIIVPARISYKHKSLLLKQTTVQKVTRFTVIGLSAAAAISLIIITYSSIPWSTSLKFKSSAHNFVPDSTLQRPSSVIATDRIITDSVPVPAEKKRENRFANIHKEDTVITYSDMIIALSDDSLVRKIDNQEMTVNKVPVYTHVDLRKGIISNTLIASNPTFNIPDVEDERSQVGRFISKTFREKFLKEKTPTDSPLKGYEIAEAGVTGLNKLFGWQMALDKKNDENGQPKSVYFSSKILKFNAPVKKREPQL